MIAERQDLVADDLAGLVPLAGDQERIAGLQRVTTVTAPHPRIAGVQTTRLTTTGEDELTAFTVAGVKWNLGRTWLLHAHVLMPLADRGLTATFTPTIALDYSLAR